MVTIVVLTSKHRLWILESGICFKFHGDNGTFNAPPFTDADILLPLLHSIKTESLCGRGVSESAAVIVEPL